MEYIEIDEGSLQTYPSARMELDINARNRSRFFHGLQFLGLRLSVASWPSRMLLG
jgi:hypothetical protein